MTKREVVLAMRDAYAEGLYASGQWSAAEADAAAEWAYPMLKKIVPFVTHLSNGCSFKITQDEVWMTLSPGGDWMRSAFNVSDLYKLGVLAKQPTIEVDDDE